MTYSKRLDYSKDRFRMIHDSVSVFISAEGGTSADTLLQRTNSYSSFPICVSLCLDKLLDCENLLLHTKHSYGFSPVCDL